jgi:hypothetical protein
MERLEKLATEKYTMADLAILCLKRFIRRKKIASISNRPTCKYNEVPAGFILNIWLSTSEHHNVKLYRIITGESVSFMTAQAVEMYLDAVARILRRIKEDPKSLYVFEWERMQDLILNSVERFIKFSSLGGKGVTGICVVMPRPVLRWEKSFGTVSAVSAYAAGAQEEAGFVGNPPDITYLQYVQML